MDVRAPLFFFRDQDIAVIGGSDSAMLPSLTRFARSGAVCLATTEVPGFKIMPIAPCNKRSSSSGGQGSIDRLAGYATPTPVPEGATLPVTSVFVAIGHEPRSGLNCAGHRRTSTRDGYVLVGAYHQHLTAGRVRCRRDLVNAPIARPQRAVAAPRLSTPSAGSPSATGEAGNLPTH